MLVLKNQQCFFDTAGMPSRLREICDLMLENRVFNNQGEIAIAMEVSKSTFDRMISPELASEKIDLEKINNLCRYPIKGRWVDPIWIVCGQVTPIGIEDLLDESLPLNERAYTALEYLESFLAIHADLARQQLAILED